MPFKDKAKRSEYHKKYFAKYYRKNHQRVLEHVRDYKKKNRDKLFAYRARPEVKKHEQEMSTKWYYTNRENHLDKESARRSKIRYEKAMLLWNKLIMRENI